MNAPLKKILRVRCPVDHAFEMFTARIDAWWPDGHRMVEQGRVSLGQGVGGAFVVRNDTGAEKRLGEILAWEPPHRLCFTWSPGAVDVPTEVEVVFSAEGDETVVRLTHVEAQSGLGQQWPVRVKVFDKGWTAVFASFSQAIAQDAGPASEESP